MATFIAPSRDYDLVFVLFLAKVSHMHIMTIYLRQQSGINPRGASVKSVFDCMHFCFEIRVFLSIDFIFPYTP